MGHEAQGPAPLLGVSDGRAGGRDDGGHARDERAATQAAHRARPRIEAGEPGKATRLPVSVTVPFSTFRMERSRVV